MSKSRSIARLLIPALLATASISGYYSWQLHGERQAAERAAQRATRDANAAQKTAKELVERLRPDTVPAQSLETVFGKAIRMLNANRLESEVSVSNVLAGSGGRTSGAVELDRLASQVPGTSIRTIRINVRGSYRNYSKFLDYLEALRHEGMAIVHLKVDGSNFELGLRVYGT